MTLNTVQNYLACKISGWYHNAKLDYGIDGKFISAESEGHNLKIAWEEMGEKLEAVIIWWTEYTPEQIYNIWMETA